MRKLIVSEFLSLDGVMQAPGGADEDIEGGFQHGGWTWPYWHDDIGRASVRNLKAARGGTIITDGSHELVHTLLQHDLVDELHLLLYPVILGGDKRLLPEGVHATFKLKAATP